MTLSVAWVRYAGAKAELVFASDSRLTGGGNIDHCQKVFALPREDCCISFAGSTMIAYPFILQVINTISDYKKVFDRAVDLTDLSGRIVALLNRFIGAHEGTIQEEFAKDLLETSFLFGGWSWKTGRFCLWRLHFDNGAKRYVAASTGVWHLFGLPRRSPMEVAAIGDYRDEFWQRLESKTFSKIEKAQSEEGLVKLDYEPLTVLSEMLTDPTLTDRKELRKGAIGGGPQVIKVYSFMRTMSYAVEWRVASKPSHVIKGRVISEFEVFSVPVLDPFTGTVRDRPTRPGSDALPKSDETAPNSR